MSILSMKCIFWQILNRIVENQDLYRNKDEYNIFDNYISKSYRI